MSGAEGLRALPLPRRLALAGFLLVVLGFYGAAQLQLALAVGGGRFPSARDVLVRYHGDPGRSRLAASLDPERPVSDPKRMYWYLGEDDEAQREAHRLVAGWLDAGARRERFADVAPLFTGAATCGKCHARGSDGEGQPFVKADLPLQTYEDVAPLTVPGGGLSAGELARTTHNHLFGFAVLALLVSWIFTATAWRGPLAGILVVGASTGIVVDVACWWLTRAHGAPFHLGIMAGGALFGACVAAMAVLSLDELLLRSRLARVLDPALRALRLVRPRPAS